MPEHSVQFGGWRQSSALGEFGECGLRHASLDETGGDAVDSADKERLVRTREEDSGRGKRKRVDLLKFQSSRQKTSYSHIVTTKLPSTRACDVDNAG